MEIISPRPWKQNKTPKFLKLLIFLLPAVLIISLILFKNNNSNISWPVSPKSDISLKPLNSALTKIVDQVLADNKDSFAVVIKNLESGENYSLNEKRVFDSASLYKLWVMAEVIRRIQSGELSEDEVLSESIPVLNSKFNISSQSAELTEGTVTMNVKSALEQMISISDNFAALLLSDKVGLSQVAVMLENNGLKYSKVGTATSAPTITASDAVLFLEKIYRGELIDEQSSQRMLELLKLQKLDNKLPKYLPEDTVIAHKTGELGRFSHDAGIVFTEYGDYIIVVLSDSNTPREAEEKIAQLSKRVYEYFSGLVE